MGRKRRFEVAPVSKSGLSGLFWPQKKGPAIAGPDFLKGSCPATSLSRG